SCRRRCRRAPRRRLKARTDWSCAAERGSYGVPDLTARCKTSTLDVLRGTAMTTMSAISRKAGGAGDMCLWSDRDAEQNQKDRARLFRRSRYLRHYEMAADGLSRRDRDVHR